MYEYGALVDVGRIVCFVCFGGVEEPSFSPLVLTRVLVRSCTLKGISSVAVRRQASQARQC